MTYYDIVSKEAEYDTKEAEEVTEAEEVEVEEVESEEIEECIGDTCSAMGALEELSVLDEPVYTEYDNKMVEHRAKYIGLSVGAEAGDKRGVVDKVINLARKSLAMVVKAVKAIANKLIGYATKLFNDFDALDASEVTGSITIKEDHDDYKTLDKLFGGFVHNVANSDMKSALSMLVERVSGKQEVFEASIHLKEYRKKFLSGDTAEQNLDKRLEPTTKRSMSLIKNFKSTEVSTKNFVKYADDYFAAKNTIILVVSPKAIDLYAYKFEKDKTVSNHKTLPLKATGKMKINVSASDIKRFLSDAQKGVSTFKPSDMMKFVNNNLSDTEDSLNTFAKEKSKKKFSKALGVNKVYTAVLYKDYKAYIAAVKVLHTALDILISYEE